MSAVTSVPSPSYPHLGRAPIIEAVIDLRASATSQWDRQAVTDRLRAELPDYPVIKQVNAVSITVPFAIAIGEAAEPVNGESAEKKEAWSGIRLTTEGDAAKRIATFTRDGFGFSHLAPYSDWGTFQTEALRLWSIHSALAGIADVSRLGVRFINRIELPATDADIHDFLAGYPRMMEGAPVAGFMHHDLVRMPPYLANLIRTVQPPSASRPSAALIVDIDVFTEERFRPSTVALTERLGQMRQLKNRLFFATVTQRVIESHL